MIQVNVVYACVINDKNEVLMVYNADSDHWSLPGGKVESGEFINEALIRETYEETGYHVSVDHLIALNECKLLTSNEHAIFFTFKCTIAGGKEQIIFPDEISKIEWVPFEKADKRMPYHKKSIRDILLNKVDYINQGED